MPRKGFIALTMEDNTINDLDKIAKMEGCKTRPEVLRLLVREYKRRRSVVQEFQNKDASVIKQ